VERFGQHGRVELAHGDQDLAQQSPGKACGGRHCNSGFDDSGLNVGHG